MLNPGASLTLLAILALKFASARVVDIVEPFERVHRADGSYFDVRGLADLVAPYNAISLKRQTDTIGSWALLSPTCPQGTVDCKASYAEGKACCTSSTTCYTDFARVNCCPNCKPWPPLLILLAITCCAVVVFFAGVLTFNIITVQRWTAVTLHRLFPNVPTHPGPCGRLGTATTFAACAFMVHICLPPFAPSSSRAHSPHTDLYMFSQGDVGYITLGHNGACGPNTLKPTGDQAASLIAQATGGVSLLCSILCFPPTPIANCISSLYVYSLHPLASQIRVLLPQLPFHKPQVPPLHKPQVPPFHKLQVPPQPLQMPSQSLLVTQLPSPLTLLAV